ncbi:hypothetical protein BDY21DRAFT_303797 [Lineolata rhizophorae]|uniref:MI domain-containing protein n=1 Tax=Lineolata rhizophorae TaxID=578093 RepID=A0A6A6P1K5_9PEZI|nr:hypothetical protein BDY21DRAFT_303797 [Lineolata rhizophorae]
MRQRTSRGPKLPRELLDKIEGTSGGRSVGRPASNRKQRRKAEREQKKAHRRRTPGDTGIGVSQDDDELGLSEEQSSESTSPPQRLRPFSTNLQPTKSILKRAPEAEPAEQSHDDDHSVPAKAISRTLKNKLQDDDNEIAALEKRLGIKSKKKLPKSFEDDGLDDILGDTGGYGSDDSVGTKRKRPGDGDWFNAKRRKAQMANGTVENAAGMDDNENDFGGLSSSGSVDEDSILGETEDEENSEDKDETMVDSIEEELGNFSAEIGDDGNEGDCDAFDSEEISTAEPKNQRENPYVPPVPKDAAHTAKYVPPSLRAPSSSEQESLFRLRKQIQGLLNRISEANMVSIVRDIEQLYQNNPRQHVSSCLIDLLMILVCDRTSLNDTFLLLHAGFAVAIYKVVGMDFGAILVERVVADFDKFYGMHNSYGSGKETSNIITFAAELYNFQMIGSKLMFGYIRHFLEELSEVNTELLLRVIRNAGSQLRQDDPTALKDIVSFQQQAIAKIGHSNLSVRTKFMIETLNDLKNNRMKTGQSTSALHQEHATRMKKMLGSLNSRTRATEPLQVSLDDVRDAEKRGKWWLVGASWRNETNDKSFQVNEKEKPTKKMGMEPDEFGSGTTDIMQLAREQRMNTDIRRAIFVAILSGTDYNDAYQRLSKLKLKKAQEQEIPRVLTHCVSEELTYNPYYALIARKLCAERRFKYAFQFTLWDLFKRIGEKGSDEDNEALEDKLGESLGTRKVVNLAKFFGSIISASVLSIAVLKPLKLPYLGSKGKTFVEILMITTILESQKQYANKQDEKALLAAFSQGDLPASASEGLQLFLRKVVAKSDLVGNKADRQTVKWGSKLVANKLEERVFNGGQEIGSDR